MSVSTRYGIIMGIPFLEVKILYEGRIGFARVTRFPVVRHLTVPDYEHSAVVVVPVDGGALQAMLLAGALATNKNMSASQSLRFLCLKVL